MNQSLPVAFAKYVSMSVCSMLAISCYVLADTFFVANGVGSLGLAALNIAIPAYMLISACGLLIGMGAATLFSIELGKGSDQRVLHSIFTSAAALAVVLGALLTALGWMFPEVFARALGATPQTLTLSATYIRTLTTFAPAFLLSQVLVCFVRNDGQPNLSMGAMVLSSFSNIVMDYIFIYPLGMGMFGAALATGVSPVISIAVSLFHFAKKENQLHIDLGGLTAKWGTPMMRTGLPHFIGELSSGLVIFLFNIVIGRISGDVGIAAYGIIANVALVILAIFNGISQGTQPLLGRSFGAGRQTELHHLFRMAALTAIAAGAAFYGVCAWQAEWIVKVFNKEQIAALADITVPGLRIYFTAFLAAGVNVVAATYFAVTLRPKAAFLDSALRGFLLVVPLVLGLAASFGMTGVWLSVPCAEAATLLVVLILYRRQGVDSR